MRRTRSERTDAGNTGMQRVKTWLQAYEAIIVIYWTLRATKSTTSPRRPQRCQTGRFIHKCTPAMSSVPEARRQDGSSILAISRAMKNDELSGTRTFMAFLWFGALRAGKTSRQRSGNVKVRKGCLPLSDKLSALAVLFACRFVWDGSEKELRFHPGSIIQASNFIDAETVVFHDRFVALYARAAREV